MKKIKNTLILGYASTGIDLVNHILKNNFCETIYVSSKNISKDENYYKHLENGVIFLDYNKEIYNDHKFDLVIKSPGIMFHDSMVFNATKNNIDVISEIEYAIKFLKSDNLIAITGSNGKTTLSTLIEKIFIKENKRKVHLCGNIGIPLIRIVEEIKKDDIVVLELSSFQLNDTFSLKPKVAIVTNINTSTHLDWHLNFKNYLSAKENLVKNMDIDDTFIVNIDDEYLWDMALKTMSSIISFSINSKLGDQGSYTLDNYIWYKNSKIINLEDVSLLGNHNIKNMLGALSVVKQFNVEDTIINNIFKTFNGVEHRQEFVGNFNGIKVYNDSKATNEVSLSTALDSMNDKVVLICGGLDRGIEFENLEQYNSKIIKAFVYGESQNKFDNCFDSDKIVKYNDFKSCVNKALESLKGNETLLLSPGCASWDQFKSFEHRGNTFKNQVKIFFDMEK